MNPILRQLGFAATDRVVVLHADDIGMCQATLPAYETLSTAGAISSAAVMVPCPWFNSVAEQCRRRAGDPQVDMGVHLTLTSEWDSYRWRPLTTCDPASGLLDGEGYFPSRAMPVIQRADLDAVRLELTAQVQRALAAGIDVTHVDSHMLTLFHPRLLSVYIDVARQFDLPPFLVQIPPGWQSDMGHDAETIALGQRLIAEAADAGLPIFDYFQVLSLADSEHRVAEMSALLNQLPAGLSIILFHPAVDTPELRALAPDWRCRVADYELFSGDLLPHLLADAGVQVIGFRALRDAIRDP
ncbi:MAG: polysaccharide deacetylase family protein [Anaerolineae bacterium]